MESLRKTYKRPEFVISGLIVAAPLGWLALTQLADGSPIAAGVFGLMGLMGLGLGGIMAGRREP
jgi:F0F1-type ATP synthase assembly protein I